MRALVAQTQEIVPIGTLGPPLEECGLELVIWSVGDEPPPGSLAPFDAVIALGGAANPDQDDHLPWIQAEREVLREALDRRLPTLGLCLGAELLAEVLGGSVEQQSAPQIGWFALCAAEAATGDPLYGSLPSPQYVFRWHGYGFDLPRKAQLLSGTAEAAQAFRYSDHAWGLQFHLEADEHIIASWITHYEDELRMHDLDPSMLARETASRAGLYARQGATFGRRFARLVERRAYTRKRTRPAA